MTERDIIQLQGFSDGFTTLLNSYSARPDFGTQVAVGDIVLNEYEKSFFLTKAQDEIVLSLYTGRTSSGNSLDGTEELRRYLSPLISESNLVPDTNSKGELIGIDGKKQFFTLPEDLWFILYESISLKESEDPCASSSLEVVPVTQDEYHRVKKNPFRGANKRRALRLDLSDGVVEIVSKYDIASYYVRYLRRPSPIVLEDLPEGLYINGTNQATPCMLHEALYPKILEKAVVLALQSKITSAK